MREKSATEKGEKGFRVLFVTRDWVLGPYFRLVLLSRRFSVSAAVFPSFGVSRGGFALA